MRTCHDTTQNGLSQRKAETWLTQKPHPRVGYKGVVSFRFPQITSTEPWFVSFLCQPQVPNLPNVNQVSSFTLRLEKSSNSPTCVSQLDLWIWTSSSTHQCAYLRRYGGQNFTGDYPANTRDVVPRLPAHEANSTNPKIKNHQKIVNRLHA